MNDSDRWCLPDAGFSGAAFEMIGFWGGCSWLGVLGGASDAADPVEPELTLVLGTSGFPAVNAVTVITTASGFFFPAAASSSYSSSSTSAKVPNPSPSLGA